MRPPVSIPYALATLAVAVLFGAIFLTGGMAHSERFCDEISSYVKKIAPVLIFPGEEEMRALALGALRVLRGEVAKSYSDTIQEL